jgi:hypothetical protein
VRTKASPLPDANIELGLGAFCDSVSSLCLAVFLSLGGDFDFAFYSLVEARIGLGAGLVCSLGPAVDGIFLFACFNANSGLYMSGMSARSMTLGSLAL